MVDGIPGTAAPDAECPDCPERLRLMRNGRNGMMLDEMALRRNRRERWLTWLVEKTRCVLNCGTKQAFVRQDVAEEDYSEILVRRSSESP